MSEYVYVSVKLYLKDGQDEESIQHIVSEVDYSFEHPEIIEHEIVEILDSNTGQSSGDDYIDVYDMSSYSDENYDDA
tara:strand:- start:3116 stop:3346 length:231 start_codon:yes stop_codon:yes gene_type:complete